MHTTKLRKVGGSVMLSVPPTILDLLHLQVDQAVDLAVVDGQLRIKPQEGPRYSLEELLARCVVTDARSDEEQEWLQSGPSGRELL